MGGVGRGLFFLILNFYDFCCCNSSLTIFVALKMFFIKKIFFILYWNLADLQCCISFRYTEKGFRYTYRNIYSFSDSFPI